MGYNGDSGFYTSLEMLDRYRVLGEHTTLAIDADSKFFGCLEPML